MTASWPTRLLSPKKHVDKTYFAVTEGKVVPEDIEKIRVGVDIGDEEPTLPGKLEILKVGKKTRSRELPVVKIAKEKMLKVTLKQ